METYELSSDGRAIRCCLCGTESTHPEDVVNLWCPECQVHHGFIPALSQVRVALLAQTDRISPKMCFERLRLRLLAPDGVSRLADYVRHSAVARTDALLVAQTLEDVAYPNPAALAARR